jgi:hypothetical protein
MTAAKAPMPYFAGARCWLEDGSVRSVEAVTPYPIA